MESLATALFCSEAREETRYFSAKRKASQRFLNFRMSLFFALILVSMQDKYDMIKLKYK